MLSHAAILELQQIQYKHDLRNHFDILSLHKNDRIKHYGLHFAKYAGRFARGKAEEKSLKATITDALLVCLSSANTLHIRLANTSLIENNPETLFKSFVSNMGKYCDGCEKIDHMEPFIDQVKSANQNIFNVLISMALSSNVDIINALEERRLQLKERAFFVSDMP